MSKKNAQNKNNSQNNAQNSVENQNGEQNCGNSSEANKKK